MRYITVLSSGQRLSVYHSTLCVKKSSKVPIFKLSVTLSNLNRFSKCLHCWKAHEICYKTHTTLATLLLVCCYTTLGNWKFKFSSDVKENANSLHWNLKICLDLTKLQSLKVGTFFERQCSSFYSASALPTMQSAVLARGIPSVRPSVTFRYCVQTKWRYDRAVFSIW